MLPKKDFNFWEFQFLFEKAGGGVLHSPPSCCVFDVRKDTCRKYPYSCETAWSSCVNTSKKSFNATDATEPLICYSLYNFIVGVRAVQTTWAVSLFALGVKWAWSFICVVKSEQMDMHLQYFTAPLLSYSALWYLEPFSEHFSHLLSSFSSF